MEENKFEKRKTCLYCNCEMEAKYRNKKFCSDKCRVYHGRENKKIQPQIIPVLPKTIFESKNESEGSKGYLARIREETSQGNTPVCNPTFQISDLDNLIKEADRPQRKVGEKSLDYKLRVAEWEENNSKLKNI